MVEYRTIKSPTSLSGRALTEKETELRSTGVDVAAGMGEEGEPSQIDIMYRDGRTYIFPVNGPKSFAASSLAGHVSPDDCRAWVRASLPKAAKSKVEK